MIGRKNSLTNISSILMAVISLLIALSIPAGYFIVSYNHLGGRIATELAFSARNVEALVINNPESWQFEEIRLQEILDRRLRSEHDEKQLIRDLQGKVIAESGKPAAGPVRIFREPVYDGRDVISYIEAESPLAPLFLKTALIGSGSVLLAAVIFLLFRSFPLRELRSAEGALLRSEAKFRFLVDNAFEAILILSLDDGKVLFANHAAFKAFEVDETFLGRSVLEFIAPESLDDVARDFMEVAGGRDGYLAEYYIITPKGKKNCIESIGKIVNYEGKPASLVSIRDITEHKRAEEEKAKLQDQLIQSRKMESVGRLAGGVAHDFNNMLGVIIGNAEIALRKIDPGHPVRTRLQDIRTAAERSANLTGQLLAFARKQTIAPKVIDMNMAIEGMLKMLGRLIGEDIKLTWSPHPDLWPVKIDPTQIDQLLANLCVNARDAISGVGEVTIRTDNAALDESWCAGHSGFAPGEYVLLAVSDNGIGMSREVLENLFEPFFTTKDLGRGTGLGLATVYGIVKQNNGFIDVLSEPDRGATFSIYLPRHEGIADPDSAEEPKAVTGSGETVLVVEDEMSVLVMVNRMLEEQGYRVLTAGTPGEAIRLAERHKGELDLLITDTIMPGMNGRDMARKILSLCPNLKCLFMSGYTADVISNKGVLDEGVHFIQKPFKVNQIALKVREVLDSRTG